MKKCIIFILKIPFLLIKYILCFIKWILKMLFGWIFGWIHDFDERMSGEEFEEYVKEILKRNGFKSLELTKRSGDYGVDIKLVAVGLEISKKEASLLMDECTEI